MNGYISPQVLTSLTSQVEKLLFLNIAEVSDEAITAFSKNLPCLKTLTVSGSSLVTPVFDFPYLEVLDSNQCHAMERVKFKCPKLVVLDISSSPLLTSVEWGCPNLLQVCIFHNTTRGIAFDELKDLTEAGKFTNDEICAMTGSCQNLNKVMMSKLPLVTDDVAVALCTLPNLRTLNVADCPLISAKTMEQLYHMFPTINFFG